MFTNSSVTTMTSAATLPVIIAPYIVSSPIAQTIDVGTGYTITAVASGLPFPNAQWQRSNDAGLTWSDVTGATAYTYPITVALGDDGAQFRSVFANSVGTATTAVAMLHVTTTTSLAFKGAHTKLKGGKRGGLTAMVTSPVTGKGKVTGGTVAFYDGSILIASVPVATGNATAVVTLAKGSHPLRAGYSGSGAVLAAQSTMVTVTAI